MRKLRETLTRSNLIWARCTSTPLRIKMSLQISSWEMLVAFIIGLLTQSSWRKSLWGLWRARNVWKLTRVQCPSKSWFKEGSMSQTRGFAFTPTLTTRPFLEKRPRLSSHTPTLRDLRRSLTFSCSQTPFRSSLRKTKKSSLQVSYSEIKLMRSCRDNWTFLWAGPLIQGQTVLIISRWMS